VSSHGLTVGSLHIEIIATWSSRGMTKNKRYADLEKVSLLVMRQYYTYIMTNKDNNVLYVGMTNDIERRVLEHKECQSGSFTNRYGCRKLVWFETFSSPGEAIHIEKRLKSWPRKWKLDLIRKSNPSFDDLGKDAYWIRS